MNPVICFLEKYVHEHYANHPSGRRVAVENNKAVNFKSHIKLLSIYTENNFNTFDFG